MDRTRKSYPEFWYKDSARVLRVIRGIIDQYKDALTQVTASPSGIGNESGGIDKDTLNHIEEVMNNAPKTFNVPAKTEAQLPMDPLSYGPS